MQERAAGADRLRNGTANVLLRLHGAISGLSPAEQRLAAYILDHPNEILYMSVHQLSEVSGVSVGTVIRFCQDFGYAGFAEFKLMLAADLVVPVRTVMGEIEPNDDIRTVAEKIATANTQAIQDTLRLFDANALEQAIGAITDAPQIEVFAAGASTVVAADAKYKFARIGKRIDAIVDPHQQAMAASLLGPGDVGLAITYSGDTKDVMESVTHAKRAGATIIAITAHSRSQVASLSDIILLTDPTETPLASGAIRSTIAQLHVLDVLFAGVFLRRPEEALRAIELTAEAVAAKQL